MNHTYIFLALISATTITHAASSDGGPAKTPVQRLEKIESAAVAQATSLQQRKASLEKQKVKEIIFCRHIAKHPQNAYLHIKSYRAEIRALKSEVKKLEERLAKIQANG